MPKTVPDEAIRELLVVENPRTIRLIFSEKHSLILKQITDEERSISEIARMLSLNPGSVHYYLKELERQGLAMQVRQEIKGGIVKKYYRAAARRIVLATRDFVNPAFRQHVSDDETGDRLIRAVRQLGYRVPDAEREEAKELMLRYDRQLKALLREVEEGKSPGEEPDVMTARELIVHIKALDDPELCRIHSQFHKLFQKVE